MINSNVKNKIVAKGWEDKNEPFGFGSRKDFMEKGNVQIVYNLFGSGYANITSEQTSNSFKAVEEYNKNTELVDKVRNYSIDYLLENRLSDIENKIIRLIDGNERNKVEYIELI